MKTLPVIAKELNNMPVTTLRYRISQYSEFLPFVTTSKGKEFDEPTEGIIRQINDYVMQGKSTEEILQLLSAEHIRDIAVVETNLPTTNGQQSNNEIVAIMQDLVAKLDRQDNLQQQINEMKMAIGELSRPGGKRWYEFWLK